MSLNETITNLGSSIINLVDKKRHGTLGLEQGDVGYDKEVWSDINKYKHSTFDIGKFEIVGSPNITEDGIASGFATGSLSPNVNLLNPNNIKISISGVLSELSETVARTYFSLNSGDYTVRLYLNRYNKLSGEMGNYITKKYIYLGGDSYTLTLNAKFKTILNIDVKNNTVQQIVYMNDELLFEGPVRSPGVFNFDTDFVFSSAKMVLGAGDYDAYTGSIDLKEFSVTVDGIEVFNGNKTGLDVIKEDNYTVAGSPVITDNGIASGFSGNNYLSTTVQLGNTFKINLEFETGDKPANSQNVFYLIQGTNRLNIYFGNAGNIEAYFSNDTTIKYCGAFSTRQNTKNNFTFELTETQVITKCNEEVKTITRDSVDSSLLWNGETNVYVGRSAVNIKSINLSTLKIYVDGNLVYQPCLKIPYTLSKTNSKIVDEVYRGNVLALYEQEGYTGYYTIQEGKKDNYIVIGSPTIVDGVVSGFALDSYITFQNLGLENASTWEVEGIVKTTGSGTFGTWLSAPNGKGLLLPCVVADEGTDVEYQLYLSSTSSSWDIVENANIKFPVGHAVKCNLKFTGTQYIYTCTDLDTSTVKTVTVNSTAKIYQSPTRLGIKRGSDYYAGSIDLNDFKIYVDGKLTYQAIIPPNYTLPMGDVYGVLSAKSNSSEIARYSMPSDKYIDLTLGASGSTYTAPANGWFNIHAKSTANNSYIEMYNSSSANFGRGVYGASGLTFKNAIEAKKGDVCTIFYANINTPGYFRFIYAEGEV